MPTWAVWSILHGRGAAEAVLTFDQTDGAGGEAAVEQAVLDVVSGWVAPEAVRALLYVDDTTQVRRGRHVPTSHASWAGDLLGCMLGEPPYRTGVVAQFLGTVTAATFVNAACAGASSLADLVAADPIVPLIREVLGASVGALRDQEEAVTPGDWVPTAVVRELHARLEPALLARLVPLDDTLPAAWLGPTLMLERCLARMPTLAASLGSLRAYDEQLWMMVEQLLRARGWLPPP